MIQKILTTSILVGLLALGGCSKEDPKPAAAPKAAAPVKSEEQLAKERAEATAQEVNSVLQTMQKKHPETVKVIHAVNKITLGNVAMFEVVTPIDVFYTDKDVNYILVGTMFSGEGKAVQNITVRPELQEQLRVAREKAPEDLKEKTQGVGGFEFFSSLPLKNGFTYTYGTGENHVAIFEDPDCPFCQDLHKMLEQIGPELNIKVTVFPFVMESLHPNALTRVQHLYCAPDATQAWKNWMLTAQAAREKGQKDMDKIWASWSPTNAPNNTCPQAVLAETWQMAGRQFGYTATPTIVFENGAVVEGSADKQVFQQMFEEVAKQKAERAAQPGAPGETVSPGSANAEALKALEN